MLEIKVYQWELLHTCVNKEHTVMAPEGNLPLMMSPESAWVRADLYRFELTTPLPVLRLYYILLNCLQGSCIVGKAFDKDEEYNKWKRQYDQLCCTNINNFFTVHETPTNNPSQSGVDTHSLVLAYSSFQHFSAQPKAFKTGVGSIVAISWTVFLLHYDINMSSTNRIAMCIALLRVPTVPQVAK